MMTPAIFALALVVVLALLALFVVLARIWWRKTVIRKSMGLSDEIVRLLTLPELIWLQRGLKEYLGTPEGATLAEDTRVNGRLILFTECIRDARSSVALTHHARALRVTGLTELPVTDGESAA